MTAPLDEFFDGFIDHVVANPTLNRGAATDYLQTETNNVTNQEGNDWFDDIAGLFQELNIINTASFAQYRNHILDDPDAAKRLHSSIRQSIVTLPASPPVVPRIRLFDTERRRDRINDRIQWAIQYRDNATTVPHPFPPTNDREERHLENTLQRGIQALRQEREQLDNQIAGRT